MPKISVNPDAKAPEFVAVAPGEYTMKFERLDKDQVKQSEKGHWMTRMRLVHLTPIEQLTNINGEALKATEVPGSVFVNFMMNPDWQGNLRQAIEATGQEWPKAMEFDDELAFGNWIQDSLENREVVARLKTSEYQGNWKNEVARFVTQQS